PEKFKKLVNQFHGGKGPYFIPEYYTGRYDHWGEKFIRKPIDVGIPPLKRLLDAGVSVCLYMFHGGTSFGFMNGANYHYPKDNPIFQPDITSYDMDAPLDEAGVPTPKYDALRELFKNYLPEGEKLPPVPKSPEFISINNIQLTKEAALFNNLPHPVKSR